MPKARSVGSLALSVYGQNRWTGVRDNQNVLMKDAPDGANAKL